LIDWVDGLFGTFFVGIVAAVACVIGKYAIDEYQFSKIPVVQVEGKLLSHGFSPSTQLSRVAPIVGHKGQGSCAVYTTGDPEKKITVWDCGKYGRLTSENKRVYQYATDRATLLIRHSEYDTRIVGMQTDG
jgi:hypothetical protein